MFDERIKNIVNLVRDPPVNMSMVNLFFHFLSKTSNFAASRTKFMKSKTQIGALLNLISEDEDGRKSLKSWLSDHTESFLDIVNDHIDNEMEAVKPLMRLPTKDLTAAIVNDFNFKTNITNVLRDKAPTLCRILFRAAQSDEAAIRNVARTPDFVSDLNYLI